MPSHAIPSNLAQSEAKRRRLRKGTHSCWQCKRRKMKCIFAATSTTICNGCQRRGAQCISQEFPEDISLPGEKTHEISDSITRAEIQTGSREGVTDDRSTHTTPSEISGHAEPNTHTSTSMISEPSQYIDALYKSSENRKSENGVISSNAHISTAEGKYDRVSRLLHKSLPSREDTERICRASSHPSALAHEIMTMPYTTLEQNGLKTSEYLLNIPEPTHHPVLISRHMLLLATFLQPLCHDRHKASKSLSESPRAIMERLADLAVKLVTTNDELLGSIEGLQCVVIESVYQANIGNLRRSWVSIRRAMTIAQLMGIDRSGNQAQYKVLEPNAQHYPRLMWYRMLFLERHLCLMLGLPQGSLDRSMGSEELLANDTPLGRVERIHCVVASRILERNESAPRPCDLALTQELDLELQKAARSLPSKWWLAPNLDNLATDAQTLFWNTRRMFTQVLHYNLLNQLHIPYMLRSSSSNRKYEYSRITCVNASREVITRFITLRSFNEIAYSCRTIDFNALMAAMTLLLAHLDSQYSGAENLLAHQYHSDRAMIEQVEENMTELNRLNSDALSAKSADLLRRLLNIDVGATDSSSAKRVTVREAGAETALQDRDDDTVVSVHVPYFGIIKISRDGMRKEIPKPQGAASTTYPAHKSSNTDSAALLNTEPPIRTYDNSYPTGTSNIGTMAYVGRNYNHIEQTSTTSNTSANSSDTAFSSQFQGDLSDPFLQHEEYPGLAAGSDDWALQGVDLAFFESLMSSAGDVRDDDTDWTTIPEPTLSNK